MLDNVAVAELTRASRKATSLADPFAIEGGLDKDTFYSSLTSRKAEQLKELENDTVQSVRDDIKLKIRVGQNLIKAKKLCKHGEFINWIKLCFGWTEATAQNQMRLAKAFESNSNIAKFKPTVAYQLTQKSCPDEVVEQAIALLESGNEVTVNTVKELKQAAKIEAIEPAKPEPEIKPEAKPEKPAKTTINKGDIVEWQFPFKGYTFGRVKSKSTDGITCKIESLAPTPISLGEKPTKHLRLCPVQKNNAENTIGDYSAKYKIEPGAKVIVRPYTTELQPFSGEVGIVIARYPEKRFFSVKVKDTVHDFFWEELEDWEEDEDNADNAIDVESEAIEIESGDEIIEIENDEPLLNSENLKSASNYQLSDLLAQLSTEMRSRIDTSTATQLDALVNQVWKEIERFSQQKQEQFLFLLIDKSNSFE